jgi:hypothetical protein
MMSKAMTATVYGRRNAMRMIHIGGLFPSIYPDESRSPVLAWFYEWQKSFRLGLFH